MTRKCTEEIDRFETKIKNIKALIIETIEYDCCKLISHLNFEEGLITEEIKELGIQLKNYKYQKRLLIQSKDHFLQMKFVNPTAFINYN